MKKKLICLLLAVTMLCMAFTSCGEKSDEELIDDITDEASEQTVTLSMYLISESKVSQTVEEEIEAAVNAITQSNFRIKLDLRYFTEDEYYDIVNDHLVKTFEDSLNYELEEEEDEEAEQTEAETVLNELGIPELKYPEISDHQVDIFYFGGYDNFTYYFDGGYLATLDAYTSSLKADVFSPFLTYMKSLNGGSPAIATNQVIGEYSFLLLNKEALKDANYSVSDIKSVYDDNCKDFVELIASEYRNEYVPFYSEGNIYDNAPGMHYWGVKDGAFDTGFSVLGAIDGQTKEYKAEGSVVSPLNTLSTDVFKNHVLTIKGYEFNGYFATDEEAAAGKDFAAGYVVGGAEVLEKYGDEYEIITLSRPTFTTKTLYSDMFGVCAFASSESACMNIITYMNTNKEFKNLLLYGIEGKHYELVESDDYVDENGDPYMLVSRYTDENGNLLYPMDNYKTGNTFLAMPEVGQNPNWIKYAQTQNRDAYISLILGFEIGMMDYELDTDQFEEIAELSAAAIEAMEACTTLEELEKCINTQNARVSRSETFRLMTTDDDPEAKHGFELDSFAEYYRDWTIAMGMFKPVEDK